MCNAFHFATTEVVRSANGNTAVTSDYLSPASLVNLQWNQGSKQVKDFLTNVIRSSLVVGGGQIFAPGGW